SPEMKHCATATALGHFPELKRMGVLDMWKGAPVFRFDAADTFGVRRVPSCEPHRILFLERESYPVFSLDEMEAQEAADRLQKDLHQETPEICDRQRQTIETLLARGCYRLRYGGDPHDVAVALRRLIDGGWNPAKADSRSVPNETAAGPSKRADPLRRFRHTRLNLQALVMGKSIRVETDSLLIMKCVTRAFSRFEWIVDGPPPQFVWRIVGEPGEDPNVCWPPLAAFSDRTMRYVNIGSRSFIA